MATEFNSRRHINLFHIPLYIEILGGSGISLNRIPWKAVLGTGDGCRDHFGAHLVDGGYLPRLDSTESHRHDLLIGQGGWEVNHLLTGNIDDWLR